MAENLPTWACSPRRGGHAVYLKSTEEDGRVTHVSLEGKRGYVLGRNKACNIVVKDKTASRFHACLAYDEHGDCYLVDLGSAHGTFLGGKQLQKEGRERLHLDNPDKSAFTIGKCPTQFQLTRESPGSGPRHAPRDGTTWQPDHGQGQGLQHRTSRPNGNEQPRRPPRFDTVGARSGNRSQNVRGQVYRSAARGVYTPGYYGEHAPPYGESGQSPMSNAVTPGHGPRGRGPPVVRGRGPPPPNGYPAGPHLPGGPGFRGRGYIDFRGRPLPGRGFGPPRGRGREFTPRGRGPRPDDRYQPEPEPVLYETADGLVVAEDEFEVEEEGALETLPGTAQDPPGVQEGGGPLPETLGGSIAVPEGLQHPHAARPGGVTDGAAARAQAGADNALPAPAGFASAALGNDVTAEAKTPGATLGHTKTERVPYPLGTPEEMMQTDASTALPTYEQDVGMDAHVPGNESDPPASVAQGGAGAVGVPAVTKLVGTAEHERSLNMSPSPREKKKLADDVPMVDAKVRESSSSIDIGGNSLGIAAGRSPQNTGAAALGLCNNNDAAGEVESPNKGPDIPAEGLVPAVGMPQSLPNSAANASLAAIPMSGPLPAVLEEEAGPSDQVPARTHNGAVEGSTRVRERHSRHHSRRDRTSRERTRHREAPRASGHPSSPHVSGPQMTGAPRPAAEEGRQADLGYPASRVLPGEPHGEVSKDRQREEMPKASGRAEGLLLPAEPPGKRKWVERVPPPEDPGSSDSELPEALARIAARRRGRDAQATDSALHSLQARGGSRIRPTLPSSSTSDSDDGVKLPRLPPRLPGAAARTALPVGRGVERRPALPPDDTDSDSSSSRSRGRVPERAALPRAVASEKPTGLSVADVDSHVLEPKGPQGSEHNKGHDIDLPSAGPRTHERLPESQKGGGHASVVEETAVREQTGTARNEGRREREERHEWPRSAGNADRSGRDGPRHPQPPRAHGDHRGNHAVDRRTFDQPRGGYDDRRQRQNPRHTSNARGKGYEERGYEGSRRDADSYYHRDNGGPRRPRQEATDGRSQTDRRGLDGAHHQQASRDRGDHRRESGSRGRHRSRSPRRGAEQRGAEPSPRRESEQRRERRKRVRDRDESDHEVEVRPAARPRVSGFGAAPAEFAGLDPADVVRQMMMGPGGVMPPAGALSLEQKKKLLWGKKVEPEVPKDPELLFGANRWDAAEFEDQVEKEKFSKLMGLKVAPTALTKEQAIALAHAEPTEREALTKDKAERVLADVEHQFMQGLRRKDGRTVGLGL